MKGIILAGGSGSRLYPLTVACNKQLLPVYDKPMIYYPLSTLIQLGIREICIISTEEFNLIYKKLFKDGKQLGLDITYKTQSKPNGIAEAILIAEDFIKDSNFCLILGDNIFSNISPQDIPTLEKNSELAHIYAYKVKDPERYGVVDFKYGVAISIEEKPVIPRTNFAVPGIYFYGPSSVDKVKSLTPSYRGELEITDLNRIYLNNQKLKVKVLTNTVWMDAGTPDSLFDASSYVKSIQERRGSKIACIEEECFKQGLTTVAR